MPYSISQRGRRDAPFTVWHVALDEFGTERGRTPLSTHDTIEEARAARDRYAFGDERRARDAGDRA